MQHNKKMGLIAVSMALVLTGCASTDIKTADPKDPYEGWNRNVQAFNDKVDNHVMKPVAKGYKAITPAFVDRGVTNFFDNISGIGVFINDALQGKFQQSGMDTARFVVNTTAGVGGLVDVGTMIDLPKHNEDFDQTLGVWGVSPGAYIVLPFLGSSSTRGIFGLMGDAAMNPISYTGAYFASGLVSSAVSGGVGAVHAVDTRSDKLAIEKIASEAAVDRYEFFKNAYLSNRNYLVKDGKVPEEDVLIGPLAPY